MRHLPACLRRQPTGNLEFTEPDYSIVPVGAQPNKQTLWLERTLRAARSNPVHSWPAAPTTRALRAVPRRPATAATRVEQAGAALGNGAYRPEPIAQTIPCHDPVSAETITMAAVARQLGSFSPMSLYRYVYSKDGLVDLMLDAVSGQVVMPGAPAGDWRGDLHAVAPGTWAVLKRHLWAAQLIHTRPPVGPNALRRLEFMLATF
jgi:hypothetical protein